MWSLVTSLVSKGLAGIEHEDISPIVLSVVSVILSNPTAGPCGIAAPEVRGSDWHEYVDTNVP